VHALFSNAPRSTGPEWWYSVYFLGMCFEALLYLQLLTGLCSAFEAGFFAGTVFYLTLFYTRGELGFRIAIFFGSALLAAAFSGLISFGVFQINDPHVQGWKWLFIIEGKPIALQLHSRKTH
jgi:MFS family permease